jgi:hypothetical protein|tara:strand:+ start:82 stop:204 length:123 start_codon:yes stop_codon:yes gene_type:complete
MKMWLMAILFFQIGLINATEVKTIRIASTANVHGETDPCG